MIDRSNKDWRLMSRPTLDFEQGTPRSREFDDNYYSPENGLEESRYVFIEGGGIVDRIQGLTPGQTLVIAELGLGTALNLALIMQAWRAHKPDGARCHIITIDKHPLSRGQLRAVNVHWLTLSKEIEALVARWPAPMAGCHRRPNVVEGLTVDFWWEDASDALDDLASFDQSWIDVWLLDGFTPSRNESMWGTQLLENVAILSRHHATLATFTASSHVRRALEQCGFTVSKRPGFGRKRECMRAEFNRFGEHSLSAKTAPTVTPWDQPETQAAPAHCLVVGAGLAGSHVARKLAESGCTVTVLEQNTIASGGSTQAQGVIYTRPSHKHSSLSDFSLTAYGFSVDYHHQKFDQRELEPGVDGELSGYLQLSDESTLTRLKDAFDDEESPLKIVSREEASEIAGIDLEKPAQYFPDSGWLHPQGICAMLLKHPKISVIEGLGAITLESHGTTTWSARNIDNDIVAIADAAVITTAWQAVNDTRLSWLPVQPIRGQTSHIDSHGPLAAMKCTVCHEGYTPTAKMGQHCVGATYGLNDTTTDERPEDHETNLNQLRANLPSLPVVLSPQGPKGQASIRCATADYLPVAGPVPNETVFLATYDGLRHDRKRIIDAKQPSVAGLFVLTGLGSRGLTSAPLLAELLVSQMMNTPPPLPRYLSKAVSPARFLRRKLVKGLT